MQRFKWFPYLIKKVGEKTQRKDSLNNGRTRESRRKATEWYPTLSKQVIVVRVVSKPIEIKGAVLNKIIPSKDRKTVAKNIINIINIQVARILIIKPLHRLAKTPVIKPAKALLITVAKDAAHLITKRSSPPATIIKLRPNNLINLNKKQNVLR